jgi:hypothetical protein
MACSSHGWASLAVYGVGGVEGSATILCELVSLSAFHLGFGHKKHIRRRSWEELRAGGGIDKSLTF